MGKEGVRKLEFHKSKRHSEVCTDTMKFANMRCSVQTCPMMSSANKQHGPWGSGSAARRPCKPTTATAVHRMRIHSTLLYDAVHLHQASSAKRLDHAQLSSVLK